MSSQMFSKKSRKLTRRNIIMLVAFIPLAITLGLWLPAKIDVVVSRSLSHRIFFLGKVPPRIVVGDYLVFKYNRSLMDPFIKKALIRQDLLTKKVGCMGGETLRVAPGRIFSCNGRPLGMALKMDSKGKALPLFDYNGVVPKGSYFMIGSDPRSFDSKYFGFVKKNEIIYRAYPIL
jgi:conjugal transfer pilin signal peptidase TrbI